MVGIRVCPWCGVAYSTIHLAAKDWCFHTFRPPLDGKGLLEVKNRERETFLRLFDSRILEGIVRKSHG